MKSLRVKLALGLAAIVVAAGAIAGLLAGYVLGEEIVTQVWRQTAWRLAAVAVLVGTAAWIAAWWLAGLLTAPLRRLTEQLRASEEKFSKAFRSNPDFIMISRLSDGRIAEVNEGFERLTGYSAARAVGQRTTELPLWFDPADRERLVQHLRRDGEVRNFEARFVTAAGAVRDVLISVTVMDLDGEAHIIGTARDITELKDAQEKLRFSEEKYAKAFHANPDYFAISRLRDGLFLEANEAFEQLTGHKAEEVIGKTAMDIGLWAYPEEREAMARLVAQQGHVRDMEFHFRTKSGTIRTVLGTAVKLDIEGDPCIIGIARDITDQKRAEEDIRRLNEELEWRVRSRTAELEQANRELESFSYSVSHDLRAPLRAIAGYANILCQEYAAELPEEARSMLVRIDRNAIRLGELIDDLLNFARIGRATLRKLPVDMRALALEVRDELLALEPERGISIRIGDLPAAWGEPSLLRQVWVNLLANALKFTRNRAQALVEVGGRVQDGELLYSVRDNGTGFDPRYSDKLFQVFQRLHRDPSFEGTGVGLAIVSRVLQRHGGRVWAEGAPDQGAAFHFALPAAAVH